MDADVACARGVEVVDRDHVLVIIRSGHGLVREVARVRNRVEIERACRIVACRDRDEDIVRVDVYDRREPSSATCVEGNLGIR